VKEIWRQSDQNMTKHWFTQEVTRWWQKVTKVWQEVAKFWQEVAKVWQEVAKFGQKVTKLWQEVAKFGQKVTKVWQEWRKSNLYMTKAKIWLEIWPRFHLKYGRKCDKKMTKTCSNRNWQLLLLLLCNLNETRKTIWLLLWMFNLSQIMHSNWNRLDQGPMP
jgi:uncharacterized protein YoxC